VVVLFNTDESTMTPVFFLHSSSWNHKQRTNTLQNNSDFWTRADTNICYWCFYMTALMLFFSTAFCWRLQCYCCNCFVFFVFFLVVVHMYMYEVKVLSSRFLSRDSLRGRIAHRNRERIILFSINLLVFQNFIWIFRHRKQKERAQLPFCLQPQYARPLTNNRIDSEL